MPRLLRSPAIVTLCVRGRPAKQPIHNERRLALLREAVRQLAENDYWAPIEALVLPGGFFRTRLFLGPSPHRERVAALRREGYVQEAITLADELARHFAGCVLIFGIDGDAPSWAERGDQFCVACDGTRIIGLARKLFPDPGETRDWLRWFVPCSHDFGSTYRYITLVNGSRAVLCACYDAFGLAETPEQPTARSRIMRQISVRGELIEQGDPHFVRRRGQCIAAFRRRFAAEMPDLALAAIHEFKRPGRDGYWQRHGIAVASAALNGGLAVGAAHFRWQLPSLEQAPLAAMGVPSVHIDETFKRRARRHYPITDCDVTLGKDPDAVLRLYIMRSDLGFAQP
jgi:hypothetical protein